MSKRTALYDFHVTNGASMVEFAGYMMPVQYTTGISAEHMAVRKNAGMFDVSHMGEFILSGKDALANLQNIVTGELAFFQDYHVKYTLICNDNGGVIDDILVYKFTSDKYMLVVNASNREKDYNHIKQNLTGDVSLEDISDDTALIAVQGPNAEKILSAITHAIPIRYYTFEDNVNINNMNILISRTGYTGEDGFELYVDADKAPFLWKKILKVDDSIVPCGLGSRDMLRIEAGMALYGHEINETIDPVTAGFMKLIGLEKQFIGLRALTQSMPVMTRVGLVTQDKGIMREKCKIYNADEEIGEITSGTFSPYLEKSIAMAYVKNEFSQIGTKVNVLVRNRKLNAEIVKLPFYSRKKN